MERLDFMNKLFILSFCSSKCYHVTALFFRGAAKPAYIGYNVSSRTFRRAAEPKVLVLVSITEALRVPNFRRKFVSFPSFGAACPSTSTKVRDDTLYLMYTV